jgi:drug/metabolite transporter (DMT)-like permease
LTRYRSEGALLVAALLFGVTFPLVHDALADIDPFAYLVLRFTIAVVVLGPFAIMLAKRAGAVERRMLIRVGILAGVLLFGGYATQTVGLQTTSPSESAFITGLYVVLTPIVESIVRRRRPPAPVLAGIALATVGLYLLTGADLSLIGTGELWTFACAVMFAVWIVYQGEYAARLGPIPFTTVQMVMVAALALPPMAARGVGDITGLAVFAAAFTGIACSAVALSLQVYGQRRIAPSRAALILLSEPVFAAIAGFVNGERLGLVAVGGALVILVGILVSELGPGRRVMPPPEILEPRTF